MGLAKADQAQCQRIKTHQRQAGVQLQLAGFRNEQRREDQPSDTDAENLRSSTRQQKTQATDGHVVHRHHGNGGSAGQRIELHGGNPEAAHKGIHQQITVFGVIRPGGSSRPLIGQVWPEQAVEQHHAPDPGRRIQRVHRRTHAQQTQNEAKGTRCVEPPGQ
ncbi:hypothetical protein D3C87_1174400 [compost metagenome]